MTKHLAPYEFVDAAEDRLAPLRRAHLDECDRCRAEFAQLRTALADVELVGDVPEPSPEFWEQFRRQLHEATLDQPAPAPSWWRSVWRPVLAAGTVAAAAVIAVLAFEPISIPDVQPAPAPASTAAVLEPVPAPSDLTPAAPAGEALPAEPRWDSVVQVASALSFEDLRGSAAPQPDAVDQAISNLSARERLQLAKLLQAEIGGLR